MGTSANYSLPIGFVLQGQVYTYTIEKVLGQGSFGITYLASTVIQGPLGDVTVQVAVKEFFAKELDSRQIGGFVATRTEAGVAYKYAQAFQRESRNLSRMKHPGIVRVLESFDANGTHYYSMEYLSGGSLDDKVKGVGIPETEALSLVRKIGDALSYMHVRKIMHLDLKPKNIMLKGKDSPVIIDFGLSKQYDSEGEPESSSSIGLGTSGYAPLEQANQSSGIVFQPTLDIYALGATLYKMLTGKTPPSASVILEEGFSEADLKAKGVSEQTISAIREAMRPIRKDRPQDIPAFLALLAPAKKAESQKPEPPETETDSDDMTPLKGASSRSVQGSLNGHEWVDLGLPSGLKWATCNVGASAPEEPGSYFAWGETEPKKEYDWASYKFLTGVSIWGSVKRLSKYSLLHVNLKPEDDVAAVQWGGRWHIPSKNDMKELRVHCKWIWTRKEGKNGYKVMGKNGNSIFLPASGLWIREHLEGSGSSGYYWLSTRAASINSYAFNLMISFSDVGFPVGDRCSGCMVRPVTE